MASILFSLNWILEEYEGTAQHGTKLDKYYKEIQVRAHNSIERVLKNEVLQKYKTKEKGRYFVPIQMQNPPSPLAEGMVGRSPPCSSTQNVIIKWTTNNLQDGFSPFSPADERLSKAVSYLVVEKESIVAMEFLLPKYLHHV